MSKRASDSKSTQAEKKARLNDVPETILAQFFTTEGESTGPKLSLPRDITTEKLHTLLNEHILKNEEALPYSFFLNDTEIVEDLATTICSQESNIEDFLHIVYQPQAVFRVQSVSRCVSSLEGHSEAILVVQFSPDCQRLATGSGDTTVRLWELNTGTPYAECKGHKNWVLCLAWSPDGKLLASGSLDKTVRVWNPFTGELIALLNGHTQAVVSLAWEPLHKEADPYRIFSGSKDHMARVWDIRKKQCLFTLARHTDGVTTVKWGGEGLIYTASKDRSIMVWSDVDGKLVRVLQKHGHWVNTLALNTDYVLRTGAHDHTGVTYESKEEAQKRAKQRYDTVRGTSPEILISGSDDCTCIVWTPSTSKLPVTQMTGHSKLINVVSFSPDGNLVVTAAFDKNLRLWTKKGKYLSTFRGHVGEVYQVAWSADSRLFVSGSKDSTMKVWDTKQLFLLEELPGHADEVYSVDWSPDGTWVASGSKDRLLKLWRS